MSIGNRLIDFIKHPRVPYFILRRIKNISVPIARFLQYGRSNLNTKKYWDLTWADRIINENIEDRYIDLRKKICEIIKMDSNVLDVGCGSGKFMKMLHTELNCSCTGIDISEVSIDNVKNRRFEGYITNLPALPAEILENNYDVITILETLEHLDHPENTLSALLEIMESEGILIITVPNNCMSPNDFDEHQQAFTVNSLTSLVSVYFKVDTADIVNSGGIEYILLKASKQ